jgi:hypothetical protein
MMDKNLDTIAVELYGKLTARFPSLEIGDEHGQVLSKKTDIPKARFFEFPYKVDGMILGTITITLDEQDGLILQIGGDLVDNKHPDAQDWIESMGQFCKRRMINCKVVNLTKSNLDKRDYHFQAKKKETVPMEPVMESKLYGTSKISYQDLGEARLVIRHTQPVNQELAAGRTMHIESIYIENAQGERFRYPYKHLNGARALAEHVKHGGNPYDNVGKYITSLSEELSQLRKFKGYVGRNETLAENMGDITSKVMERIEQIKKQVSSLQRPTYYEAFAESFEASEVSEIPESTMNDWIDRLTIRTFNEELKSVFPYIFKIVGESDIPVKDISPEDLLDEEQIEESSIAELKKESFDPFAKFELAINAIVEDTDDQEGTDTLFSPNPEVQAAAVEKLNTILSTELTGGPEGVNAIQSLKGIIDDPEFTHMLSDIDPNLDARALVQQYVLHRQADLLPQLHFGTGELGGGESGEEPPADMAAPTGEMPPLEPEAPAPATEPVPAPGAAPAPAPAPAAGGLPPLPPQPMAESEEVEDEGLEKWNAKRKFGANGARALASAKKAGSYPGKMSKLRRKFIKAWESGVQLEDVMDFGYTSMSVAEAIAAAGLTPMECGYAMPEEMESFDDRSGEQEVEDSIKGFYNQEEGNFTIGGTRAKIKIKKAFTNGEYENADVNDVKAVMQKIDQIDPSSSEQQHIAKLAGIQQAPDAHHMSAKVGDMQQPNDAMAKLIQIVSR